MLPNQRKIILFHFSTDIEPKAVLTDWLEGEKRLNTRIYEKNASQRSFKCCSKRQGILLHYPC